jgi:hypothetical protein
MNDRIEIERFAFADHRVELYPYPLKGFSVRYIPGLDELKPGAWLDLWATKEEKRLFHFGAFPEKGFVFATKEEVVAAQTELEYTFGVITVVAE